MDIEDKIIQHDVETNGYVFIEDLERTYGRKFTPEEIEILKQNTDSFFPEVDILYQMDVDSYLTDDEELRSNINCILFNKEETDWSIYDKDGTKLTSSIFE